MLLLGLVLVLCWTHLGAADGNVEIYFDQFVDTHLKQNDSVCCRPPPSGTTCNETCDNFFEVCYRVDSTGPRLGCKRTGVIFTEFDLTFGVHVRTFTSNENLGNNVKNPVPLSFDGFWRGGLNLEIKVWNNYTNPASFITLLKYEDNSTSYGSSNSTVRVVGSANTKFLDFIWQVRCSDHFYNEDCSLFCKPVDDDIRGHYGCLSNGTKICLPGWTNLQNNCTTNLTPSVLPTTTQQMNGTTSIPMSNGIPSYRTTKVIITPSNLSTQMNATVTEGPTNGRSVTVSDKGLQQGDYIAIGVGVFSAIVITLLVVYIICLKTGRNCCNCRTAETPGKGRSNHNSRPYRSSPYNNTDFSPYSRENHSSLGSVSDTQIWPEKKVSAPSLQRPRLNLHYYPESHADWDVTQT